MCTSALAKARRAELEMSKGWEYTLCFDGQSCANEYVFLEIKNMNISITLGGVSKIYTVGVI